MRSVPTSEITAVEFESIGRGALEGLGLGIVTGVALGALLGFTIERNSCGPSDFCIYGLYAIVGGLAVGGLGGVVGLIAGGISKSSTVYAAPEAAVVDKIRSRRHKRTLFTGTSPTRSRPACSSGLMRSGRHYAQSPGPRRCSKRSPRRKCEHERGAYFARSSRSLSTYSGATGSTKSRLLIPRGSSQSTRVSLP